MTLTNLFNPLQLENKFSLCRSSNDKATGQNPVNVPIIHKLKGVFKVEFSIGKNTTFQE